MRSSLFVLVAALAACTSAQRPYRFAIPGGDRYAAFEAAQRVLAAEGHPAVNANPGTGVIASRWEQTGFGYGFVQGAKATIVKRFLVTVSTGAAGLDVAVRADLLRCAEGARVGDRGVDGICEPMSGVLDAQQAEVDRLGAALQAAATAR